MRAAASPVSPSDPEKKKNMNLDTDPVSPTSPSGLSSPGLTMPNLAYDPHPNASTNPSSVPPSDIQQHGDWDPHQLYPTPDAKGGNGSP
jgi:hypothetical protein